jgi:hypothetical protein
MKLRTVVISALLVATMSAGITGFISDGLSEYGVQNNVDTGSLDKLEKIENATSITKKAQERASNVESKSNFFNLPGVFKTAKLTFDAVGLWDTFISIILSITGLNAAHGGWIGTLAIGALTVTVTFILITRVFK